MEEQKPVVLMIEDDMVLRNIAGGILSKYFDATCTLNGNSALSFTKTRVPDAFLIDIMLPDISGLDLLEQWRADSRFDESAMIVFSNLSDNTQKRRAKELGADAYYVKADVDVYKLPAVIERHIARKRKKGWFS